MPPKFGVIAKAFTTKPDIQDTDTILDLYILAYNQNNNLVTTSQTIKNNLITYLNQSRMIGDTVNIKDAFIINICIDFEIITLPNVSITNKAGTNDGYSQYAYDISGATQGGIIYPSLDPSIFEVKYPNNDITGRVVSLGSGTFNAFGGGASSGY